MSSNSNNNNTSINNTSNGSNKTTTTVMFHRPNAGTHTVEGSVAGSRAVALQAQRERDQQAFEEKQAAIRARSKHLNSATMFASSSNTASNTTTVSAGITGDSGISTNAAMIGLVSAQDFIAAQKAAESGIDPSSLQKEEEQVQEQELTKEEKKALRKERKKRKREEQKIRSTLSFAGCNDNDDDDDEDRGGGDAAATVGDDNNKVDTMTKKKSKTNSNSSSSGWTKDPTVDTSFLPDKQRDANEQLQRKILQNKWQSEQEQVKQEKLEITYSYWDGSGHRRQVTCKKGDTIGEFLTLVLQDLVKDFRQLSGLTNDDLLYIKEDLILPSDITFYDLIVTKARGKSGPLFHFDIHDDIRIGPIDTRIEKDESHPGKVVQRQWYDRSKHIFPASRWELYDPSKEYGTYTIGGNIVQSSSSKK